MAEFLQDSFDGEHLLPSDIFITEPPSKHGLTTHFSSCTDDLAQQLSTPPFKPTQNLQRFGPVHVPVCPVRCYQENCFKTIPKPGLHSSELYYEYNMRTPVQPNKVGVFGSRVLQIQHYQQQIQLQLKLNQNRVLQNRFNSGGGFGVGGFVKVSGGTGVFHPRVLNTSSNISPTTINKPVVNKRQVMRHNRSEIALEQQQTQQALVVTNFLLRDGSA